MSSSPTVRSGGFSSIAAGANDAFVPVVGRCFYRTLLRWRNNNPPATARLKPETMRVTLEEFSPAYDFFDFRGISNSRRQFLGALLVHYNLQMRPSQCK